MLPSYLLNRKAITDPAMPPNHSSVQNMMKPRSVTGKLEAFLTMQSMQHIRQMRVFPFGWSYPSSKDIFPC